MLFIQMDLKLTVTIVILQIKYFSLLNNIFLYKFLSDNILYCQAIVTKACKK